MKSLSQQVLVTERVSDRSFDVGDGLLKMPLWRCVGTCLCNMVLVRQGLLMVGAR